MKNYIKFREDDIVKSKILAAESGVSEKTIKNVENWFGILLSEHRNAKNFEQQLVTEKKLEKEFNSLYSNSDIQCSKYIFTKLLAYNNIFESGFLKSEYVPRISYLLSDTLIPQIFKIVQSKFSSSEFVSLSKYLKKQFYVSPNGELLEYILKIEKSSKAYINSDYQNRLEIVKNLTQIIKDTKYHHDIKCFKKIISFVTEDDKDVIIFLKQFQVKNKQGCYQILAAILNSKIHNGLFTDFELKRELISLFDAAKGAIPNDKWLSEIKGLIARVGLAYIQVLESAIGELTNPKKYKVNSQTYWTDDVSSRFLKSLKWINDYS